MTPTAITYFDEFEGPNKHAFLSNFYRSKVQLGNLAYPTGEHAFQAFKATSTRDHLRVRDAKSPSDAKRIGKTMELRKDWEAIKYDVMRQVLRAKFGPDSALSMRLLATGDAMLIEGNTWNDKVWGVDRNTAKGRNWLGHLLMARRAELRSGWLEEDITIAMKYIR